MIRVLPGDCLAVMPTLEAGSFDAIVTDPPYGLGFMGKAWDHGVPGVPFWTEALRVLKPGGHLAAFGGTRTFHRMAVAIEDAGFEIRDTLSWLYGTGFPKSHDVSKGIDAAAGAVRTEGAREWSGGQRKAGICKTREDEGTTTLIKYDTPATPEAAAWQGWGTALKPGWEPIILARKPLAVDGRAATVAANVLHHGTGAIHIDACRIEASADDDIFAKNPHTKNRGSNEIYGAFAKDGLAAPYDPTKGRWPANVAHDGSDEVMAAFAAFGEKTTNPGTAGSKHKAGMWGVETNQGRVLSKGDSGMAARFFFSAKADKGDRADSRHPTVKPVDLIRWLVALITPPGGHVLDPFAGSGTTGEAAMLLGFDCSMIERETAHVKDIEHRIKRWSGQDAPLFADPPAT